MELNRLNTQTMETVAHGKATIRFSKTGAITLSPKTIENMELDAGDSIEVVQDKENPADFFIIESDNGFKLRRYGKAKHFTTNSSKLVAFIFKSLKITNKQSIGCQVSSDYIIEQGEHLWPIITSSAH